ncbi:hypothetical protein RGU76_04580 [Bacillus pseudomycoides]|uniref:hypothetical protein n=1 Tax=Bacillus TaxID=1386 RepID=UPI00224910BA|nr:MULTISPECIES: hypothetical protein [Bacillus]MCX2826560.1 hypothetical protein [Bacillus sp. DHT2]MDR4914407.1 hypothetical protein [Bacillus pseudomycoides]
MSAHLNEMELFYNSPEGQLMRSLAKEKIQEVHAKLDKQREKIREINEGIRFIKFGNTKPSDYITMLDGNPVKLTTDGYSRIASVEVITNDTFKDLSGTQRDLLKNQNPVMFQKLKLGAFNSNLSEKFFSLLALAENNERMDILMELESAPTFDMNSPHYYPDAHKYYDSVAEMSGTLPVPSSVKRLREAMTVQNIRELSMERNLLEKHLMDSEKSNKFLPFEKVLAEMENNPNLSTHKSEEEMGLMQKLATQFDAEEMASRESAPRSTTINI